MWYKACRSFFIYRSFSLAYTDVSNKDAASCEIHIMRADGSDVRRLRQHLLRLPAAPGELNRISIVEKKAGKL
jgi:hypothetical protein